MKIYYNIHIFTSSFPFKIALNHPQGFYLGGFSSWSKEVFKKFLEDKNISTPYHQALQCVICLKALKKYHE